jgi:hypothetical protein
MSELSHLISEFGVLQEQLINQKLIPTKAKWNETVWQGPIDFISSRAEGDSESQTLQNPQNGRLESEAADPARSNGNQSENQVDAVGSVQSMTTVQLC